MPFIAGAYKAEWGRGASADDALVDIGITENGFDLEINYFMEEITGDNLGATVQDVIYRGGNCFLSCVLEEWDRPYIRAEGEDPRTDGSTRLLSMFSGKMGTDPVLNDYGTLGEVGIVGRLGSQIPNVQGTTQLRLTSTTDTAAEGNPAHFYADRAIIAPGFSARINFNSRLRKIPIRFQLLPSGSAGSERWFHTD